MLRSVRAKSVSLEAVALHRGQREKAYRHAEGTFHG